MRERPQRWLGGGVIAELCAVVGGDGTLVPHGPYVDWSDDVHRIKHAEGSFDRGRRTGRWIGWWYKGGIPPGPQSRTFKRWEGQFVDDLREGVWSWYHLQHGDKELETTFHRGERHGPERAWRYAGPMVLERETGWRDGRRDGLERRFHRSGAVWEEHRYVAGELDGLERGWFPNGQRAWERRLHRGRVAQARYWSEEGAALAEAPRAWLERPAAPGCAAPHGRCAGVLPRTYYPTGTPHWEPCFHGEAAVGRVYFRHDGATLVEPGHLPPDECVPACRAQALAACRMDCDSPGCRGEQRPGVPAPQPAGPSQQPGVPTPQPGVPSHPRGVHTRQSGVPSQQPGVSAPRGAVPR